ncbi:hypothetical protein SUDANB58_05910 (plasmid) [Streptomyces sp. enrichment culture]|uniref:hypothetical protein n=1 Tax=Streptomyces sp. enrichment culture TaxID=1795815 RepID=UPI003F574264
MLTDGGGKLTPYAGTVSGPLSAVIPGYDEPPSNGNDDEAAFMARYEAAIETAFGRASLPGPPPAGLSRGYLPALYTGASTVQPEC